MPAQGSSSMEVATSDSISVAEDLSDDDSERLVVIRCRMRSSGAKPSSSVRYVSTPSTTSSDVQPEAYARMLGHTAIADYLCDVQAAQHQRRPD